MKMKNWITVLTLAFAIAANAETGSNSTITIKTDRESKQLVEQWIQAYRQIHPEVSFILVGKAQEANLTYINNKVDNHAATYVGRYALLPVTTKENPLLGELQKKNWGKEDIKKLYFAHIDEDIDPDDVANSGKAGKLRKKLNVYSGANATSASAIFARYFGFQNSEFRGTRLSGDDSFLLNAIEDDKESITFNNLAYLFDTQSGKLKANLAILPLNTNKKLEETLQHGTLENIIRALETHTSDVVPVGDFGFVNDGQNPRAEQFLKWIVKDGQQYNNKAGYLKIDHETTNQQPQLIANR